VDLAKKINTTRETASRRVRDYLKHKGIINPDFEKRLIKWEEIHKLRYIDRMKWSDISIRLNDKKDSIRRFYKIFINDKYPNV